jgi:signal transduction histidine kinase/ligand-binding sensor domain-containing protein
MFPARVRSLIAAWCGALLAAMAGAQEEAPWARRTWETDEGLPHNGVNAVLQRADGFLWLATQGGLVRFDGVEFAKSRSPLLSDAKSSGVRAVIEGDGASLLIASDASGLLRLRGDALAVHPLTARFGPGQRANWLFREGGTDVFWIVFAGRSIWRCRGDDAEMFPPPAGLPATWAASFARTADGAVYLGRGTGVERYEAGQLAPVATVPPEPATICAAKSGGLWVVMSDRLCKLERGALTVLADPVPWPGNTAPNVLLETSDGALWIGTRANGLWRWHGGAAEIVGTSHPRINDLLEDNEGSVWAATSAGGLNRIRRARFTLHGDSAGILPDIAGGVCEDAQGQLWFANRYGIGRVRGGRFVPLPNSSTWPRKAIPILCDGAGLLWIGAGTQLCKVDPASDAPPTWLQIGDQGTIHALFRARDGSIWMGGERGPVLQFRGDHCTSFGEAEGFTSSRIQAIGEDTGGCMWIGTEHGEVFQLSGARFVRFGREHGLPGSAIRAIHGDAQGTVWIGTGGGGLLVRRDGRFAAITETHGLPDDVISQLLEDDAGALWCASSRGLFKAQKAELLDCAAGRAAQVTPVLFNKSDGLAGFSAASNYQPAACKTASGLLCFVGRKGLVITNPAQPANDLRGPRIYLEGLLVDGKPAPMGRVEFPSTARTLEFQYTAPTYRAPEKTQFRYRLVGLDPAWIEAGTQRLATFNRLAPGRYRFEVTACNDHHVWNPTAAALPFDVLPAWWETVWARIAAVILGGALLAGLVRYWSHRRLKARLAQLESKRRIEIERTRIARDLHDSLGASLTQVGMMAEELSEDGAGVDEMRAQSAHLAGRVRTIARDLDAVVWAVSPKHDRLDSLCAYLCQFSLEYFRDTSTRCRVHTADDIPAVALSPEARHHLFLTAREAMNNVLKHAHATEVTLTMEMNGGRFELAIADNGRGFDVPSAEASERNGLRNMRARIGEIGGQFEITSTERGTAVKLRLPVGAPEPRVATNGAAH